MKNKKIRIEYLPLYDKTAIIEHLEKMASKGWLVDDINPYFWTYKKIEPQQLKFDISYYAKSTRFDSEPSEELQNLYDLCEHNNWRLLLSASQLQIFVTDKLDAIPINTEPLLELEAINKIAKKGLFISLGVFFMMALWWLSIFHFLRVEFDIISLLASTSKLPFFVLLLMVITLTIMEIINYFVWYSRAKQSVETGGVNEVKAKTLLVRIHTCLFVIVIMLVFLNALFSGDNLKVVHYLLVFITTPLIVWLPLKLQKWFKEQKVGKGENILFTLLFSLFVMYVLVSILFSVGFTLLDKGNFHSNQFLELPLWVHDVRKIENIDREIRHSYDTSALFEQFKHRETVKTKSDSLMLNYTITNVKIASLYDFCENSLLSKIEKEYGQKPEQGDADVWQTQKLYQLKAEQKEVYLICYQNRIIELETSIELSTEDKKRIANRFNSWWQENFSDKSELPANSGITIVAYY